MSSPEDRWDDVLTALEEQGYLTTDDISERVANELVARGWLVQVDSRFYLNEPVARNSALDGENEDD